MSSPLSRDQQRLVEQALPVVRTWVRTFAARWPKVPKDELESIAYLETTETVRSHDSSKGPFLAYLKLPVHGALMNAVVSASYGKDAEVARIAAATSAFCRDEEPELSGTEALDAAMSAEAISPRADLAASLKQRATTFVAALLVNDAASAVAASKAVEDDWIARYDLGKCSEAIRRAMAGLPKEERDVVEAFHQREETLDEIAARCRVAKRTVSRRHDRAKKALAAALDEFRLEVG